MRHCVQIRTAILSIYCILLTVSNVFIFQISFFHFIIYLCINLLPLDRLPNIRYTKAVPGPRSAGDDVLGV